MFSALLRRAMNMKEKVPLLNQIHLNFILVHFVYIASWTVIGSIVLYFSGNISYVDALFFASGAATQSGMNPLNLNQLRLYQQIGIYIICMCTTPIFINTALVFIRLYWFEKRFQHVVLDARKMRRGRSRARTFSDSTVAADVNQEESGIPNRFAVAERADEPLLPGSPVPKGEENPKSNEDVSAQVKPKHPIAFLQRQRRNTGALRIPSPWEFEQGATPVPMDDADNGALLTEETNDTPLADTRPRNDSVASEGIGPTEGPHITINEPDIMRTRIRETTFPPVDSRVTIDRNDSWLPTRGIARRGTFATLYHSLTSERDRPTLPYLTWNATVERNSNFVDLTEEQMDELGGIEYRALKTLALVLVVYYSAFHLMGAMGLVPWIMAKSRWGDVVRADGVGRPWWGIFTSASAFNNLGFTLTGNSMQSFATTTWPLLFTTFLIVIGNTGFPCMLRFIIWVCEKSVPLGSAIWEELRFLLDHPRRCFTLLFPQNATWWLLATLLLLNGIDLIFFLILEGSHFLEGLFQAVSTRTAGFAILDLQQLHPAIQVTSLIMMYISVFPIAISMRRTNVYEEKSLGIYATDDEMEQSEDELTHAPSYIGFHLRRQLSFDLWYVAVGMVIIAIAESDRLQNVSEYYFSLWNIIFEVVSAYGTVGLSLGYPTSGASFAAEFTAVSKLVMIAMQIRGRHRGLPYALDRAILLPSESLTQTEREEIERRMRRRASRFSDPFANQDGVVSSPVMHHGYTLVSH